MSQRLIITKPAEMYGECNNHENRDAPIKALIRGINPRNGLGDVSINIVGMHTPRQISAKRP